MGLSENIIYLRKKKISSQRDILNVAFRSSQKISYSPNIFPRDLFCLYFQITKSVIFVLPWLCIVLPRSAEVAVSAHNNILLLPSSGTTPVSPSYPRQNSSNFVLQGFYFRVCFLCLCKGLLVNFCFYKLLELSLRYHSYFLECQIHSKFLQVFPHFEN